MAMEKGGRSLRHSYYTFKHLFLGLNRQVCKDICSGMFITKFITIFEILSNINDH